MAVRLDGHFRISGPAWECWERVGGELRTATNDTRSRQG